MAPVPPSPPTEWSGDRSDRLADLWSLHDDRTAPVPFSEIVKARRARLIPALQAQARFLEHDLTTRFENQAGDILDAYFGRRATSACVLTAGRKDNPDQPARALHTVLNTTSDRLISMQIRCEILCQDANAVFGHQPRLSEQLANSAGAVYGAMTRVLAAAELLADPDAAPARRRAGLIAARKEVQLVTERVSLLIQRQARFTYLAGVLAGAVATLLVIAAGAVVANRYWSGVLDPPAFTAAAAFGALGAVVSVLQRISTGSMVLDYSAPVRQKALLGGLRPVVGLVSGLVVHFALLAGLTTGQNGSTSVAFAATVGFVAGFSERLLQDMVERAGQLLTGRADGGPDPRAPATGGADVDADIVADVRDEEIGAKPVTGAPDGAAATSARAPILDKP